MVDKLGKMQQQNNMNIVQCVKELNVNLRYLQTYINISAHNLYSVPRHVIEFSTLSVTCDEQLVKYKMSH